MGQKEKINHKKEGKKNLLARFVEKLDKKLEAKAKNSGCGCNSNTKGGACC